MSIYLFISFYYQSLRWEMQWILLPLDKHKVITCVAYDSAI